MRNDKNNMSTKLFIRKFIVQKIIWINHWNIIHKLLNDEKNQ